MVKIRSNFKKKLKRRLIVFTILLSTLFTSFFLVRNTDNISHQIKVKEINIGANNDKKTS